MAELHRLYIDLVTITRPGVRQRNAPCPGGNRLLVRFRAMLLAQHHYPFGIKGIWRTEQQFPADLFRGGGSDEKPVHSLLCNLNTDFQ